jgi:Ribonuclease G/E
MTDADEIQQRHKKLRSKTAATSRKQEGIQQDCQAAENEWLDIVEEQATAQAEEVATHSWSARDVGALATLGSFACT